MTLDAALAYLHLLAILSWTVFLSSTAALARPEWLNTAALARLRVVDRIAHAAGWLTLASGLARVVFSPKGAAWLWGQPLLWAKLLLMLLMLAAAWQTRRQIAVWHQAHARSGTLPPEPEVTVLRRRVMRAAHLMLVLPALGVMLARGIGTW
jgi:putative membrane protein